jgi:hypothetical protein
MNMKRALAAILIAYAALLPAAVTTSSSQTDPDYEATIAALQTQVADLEEKNETLREALEVLSGLLGEESQSEQSDDIEVGSLVPNASIGDGIAYEYSEWQIRFVDVEQTTRLEEPDTDGLYWPAQNEFCVVKLRVENISNTSKPFPREDFVVFEEYGADYQVGGFLSDSSELGGDVELIPGNQYDVWLQYDLPEEAVGLLLVTVDQSLVVSVDA